MIIIKNILYFIQITHTDDFCSTGTRLVCIIIIMLQLSHAKPGVLFLILGPTRTFRKTS